MTKLNRAFIKAYRQDVPQLSPGPPASAAAARVPLAPPPAAIEQAPAEAWERSAIYGPRPHKKPLSAFTALSQPCDARTAALRGQPELLKPGTVVAALSWPAVCRRLAHECGAELDSLAELLAVQATAGRSLVAILGLHPGQGASTVALCVARQLAARGRRTVLVDGHFTRPGLAQALDVVPTAGWQDALLRGAPLGDAVIRANDDRLDLLALGPQSPPDALRVVSGLQAVVTAGVLRHSYECVLVDAGSFFDPASQPIILAMLRNLGVDAVVAVAGTQGADAHDELTTLEDHLRRSGCELLGVVENRVLKS